MNKKLHFKDFPSKLLITAAADDDEPKSDDKTRKLNRFLINISIKVVRGHRSVGPCSRTRAKRINNLRCRRAAFERGR